MKVHRYMHSFFFLSISLITLLSCEKKELEPAPIGDPVPYEETETTLNDVLEDPVYSVFRSLWSGSNMDSIVASKGEIPLTFLIPDNEAFTEAGITESSMIQMTVGERDSLLCYHVLASRLDPVSLEYSEGNAPYPTLLVHPVLKERMLVSGGSNGNFNARNVSYTYKHYIGRRDDQLLIDGKDAGEKAPTALVNGIVWPVHKVLQRPKPMLEVLREDERFSMFLGILQASDNRYLEIGNFPSRVRFSLGKLDIYKYGNMVFFATLIAPTNEAFQKAGFNSVEELMAFNRERGEPQLIGASVQGAFATDTMLNLNLTWGDVNWTSFLTSGTATSIPFGGNTIVAYSNQLSEELFPNPELPPVLGLEFIRTDDGTLLIKGRGSDYEAATVVDADINTMNGPIHAVDRLILPPNFRLPN